ncbi:N-acetylmuramoyl-L-alanine amidase [Hydrogenoanaerobacterium sp.]|uniref:N-acetylmuramoyl-L-alanine amidase family protein n=1 Tax=Hydrogenoanaerobacterium sp. TaxID=2953763 RepID=UPI0028965826|nr:N-acetylmuramoyl-L-alanine amidase [Hydrogenoanaerobacterium sp.]
MSKVVTKTAAILTAACLAVGGLSIPAYAASGYNDFDYITSHVSTWVPQNLNITRPSKNVKTSATAYYITGNSNPDYNLYINGEIVANRGKSGSFGVYVSLNSGDNTFDFTQDTGVAKSITITQGSGYGSDLATINNVSSMYPSCNTGELAGTEVTLQCIAPAGASVTATVNGTSYPMRQVAAAQTGIPATFKASYTVPSFGKTTNLGHVKYTLSYNGANKTYTSGGQLFAGGETLLVQVTDPSSSIFAEGNTSSKFITTAKIGATDYVVGSNSTMYQLGMGGWILKNTTEPLTAGASSNKVSGVSYKGTAYGERFIFSGTAQPVVTTSRGSDTLTITLHHTTGIDSVSTDESKLFTGASVSEENGDTTITFNRDTNRTLWGYVIEYKDSVTTLYCKYKPTLSGNSSKPLAGVLVAIDAGHGGSDPGALGIMNGSGISESNITANTAIAVKKRLESLGAEVLLEGSGVTAKNKSDYVERMMPAYSNKADFFISLHCNSIGTNQNGLKPNGIEIYYYEGNAKAFGNTLLSHMLTETGRASRGVKFSNFRVTLNSCAPSVLVEMGFITNPKEFDDMASRRGMFNMANAIGDGIIDYLS